MIRFLIALFVISGLIGPVKAQPVDGGHAVVELVAEQFEATPGSEFYAGLKMDLDDGWHVYWRNPGDAGLPPDLRFPPGMTVQTGEFLWPTPHLLPVVPNEIMDYGYEHQVVLPFKVTLPDIAAGSIVLEGVADYLICEDICIPEQVSVRLEIGISDTMVPDVINGQLIGAAVASVPTPFDGEVLLARSETSWTMSFASTEISDPDTQLRFYPYTHAILHAADQPAKFGDAGACLTLIPDEYGDPEEAAAPIEGVLIADRGIGARQAWTISAADGAVIAGTCTLAAGASAAGGSSVLSASGSGSVGLVSILLFALLGGLILNLMPCVLPVLSIKALGVVQSAASGEKSDIRAHGIWYTIGVLVSFAVIAGAFLAVRAATGSASLGFQLQYAPAVAVLALIMFVIGLWLLGMFELGGSMIGIGSGLAGKQGSTGAFFTGILAAVVGAPCVGPFLGVALGAVLTQPAMIVMLVFLVMGLGLALPFLVLSFAPGLQHLLPKPGAWMERLKQFFAFPMFLTAAWLLSVLMSLAGISATTWTIVGAIMISFGIWALKSSGGRIRTLALVFGGLMLVAGLILPIRASLAGEPMQSRAYNVKFETEDWSTARIDELVAEERPIFVDFTASWCVNCQLNKATTLKRPSVRRAFQDYDVAFLVADFTARDPEIAAELQRRGRPGVPMYLYYAPGDPEPTILPAILSAELVINMIEGAD